MKNTRFFADYGMIMVLLLLCIFFSIVTHGEQSPTGEAAARQVLASISGQGAQSPRVLIAASDQPGDAEFASTLERTLTGAGARVVATVRGGPRDAREALVKASAGGEPLDAIACTQAAGAWLVFADL